jgi:SPP1 gp7 family putative phage head morphogenesis protein
MLVSPGEREITKILIREFVRMHTIADEIMLKYYKKENNEYLDEGIEELRAAISQQINRIISQSSEFLTEWAGDLQDEVFEHIAQNMQRYGFSEDMLKVILRNTDVQAAEEAIRMFSENSEVMEYLREKLGNNVDDLIRIITEGLAAGRHPYEVSRVLRDTIGMLLTDAIRYARSLMLKASREVSLRWYRANSDIIVGWRWLATLDDRTCFACLMLDGKVFPLSASFDEHPNGRCSSEPIFADDALSDYDIELPDFDRTFGKEWFEDLPESEKMKILGPSAYRAYKAGEAKPEDFIGHKKGPFGPMYYKRSLREILGDRAKDFYR